MNKISLPEAIIITGLIALSDMIEFALDLTGFGIIIGIIVNFVTGAAIQFYLFLKGIKGFWKLGTNITGTMLDGLTASFLPVKTITWLITLILVNRGEKIMEHSGSIGKIGEKIAKK